MKYSEIEIGKTYAGKTGKPRTVIAKHRDRYMAHYFDVEYTTGTSENRRCWCTTFASWATSDSPTDTVTKLVDALKVAESALMNCAPITPYTGDGPLVQIRAALALVAKEEQ